MPTKIEEAFAHLGAVLMQTASSDDQIIIGHIRDAHALLQAALRAPSPSAGSIPTCCVTGAIPGDGGACGDCDPCIMGEASVPEPVKRLIAEKNGLLQRVGELEDRASTALELIPDDDADFTPDIARKIIAKYQEMLAATPPSPSAGREEIARIKDRIDTRLNNVLCEMKEGWDDSVVGFNEAWDIVRAVFKDELGG